jgi:hypothetical protein
MLRLRFASQVPDHAVNVAFVEAPDLGVRSNVALLDLSYKRVENLSAYVDGELNVNLQGTNRVDTDEIVLSPRSVLSRGLVRPIPLFYKHVIGRGSFSVVVHPSNPADLGEARYEMLKQFQILDRNNNKITGPAWDVEVTGQDSNGNYIANLYLDYRQNSAETFKLRYQAADYATGASYPNHIEVINAVPALQVGVNYGLNPALDGGYYITTTGSWISPDGIGLFYTGIYASKQARFTGPISLVLPASTLEMELDAGGTLSISLYGKSIQNVVEEINNKNIEWTAVPMMDNPICLMSKVSWVAVTKYGLAFKQFMVARVRYLEETRVSALLPYKDLQYVPWYPRVDLGQFSQSGVLNGANCKFMFKPQGNAVTLPPGRDGVKYDRLDEKPVILAPKILKLRRPNLDPASLVATYGGRQLTDIVDDYDQLNSILFLTREFGDISKLFISYSYTESSVIYTGIDLNPLGGHSPALLGKFVGIYMTPAEVTGPVPPLPSNPVTFERTLFHIVGESIANMEAQVAAVRFDTGEDAKALLLGIYRVGQAATIDEAKVTDTRSEGGGLKDIEEPSKAIGAEETSMFWDFSLWDGEPFPPTAVVASYPSELLGTGQPPIEADPWSRAADPSGFHYPSGLLTPQQIQAKLDRYKAGGVLIIINPEDSLNG